MTMTKYIVTRTSMWQNEKPVSECEPIKVHRCYSLSKNSPPTLMESIKKRCDSYTELEDGGLSYVNVEDCWACEILDLCEFVNEHGTIILMKPDNEEGLWVVEIYDDYRE